VKLTDLIPSLRRDEQPLATGHAALRETVEGGRRAKFSEDYPAARRALDAAYELARRDRVDAAGMAVVALQRSEVLALMGDFDAAEAMLAELLIAPEHDLQRAYLLCASAQVAAIKGSLNAARMHAEKALDLAKAVRTPGAEGRAMGVLAQVYFREGNTSYAAHLLRDLLPKLNTTGEIELSSAYVGMLGEALIANNQEAEGVHLIERALILAEQIGYRRYERRWKVALGTRALLEGRCDQARNYLQRAVPQFKQDTPTPDYVETLIKLARACLCGRELEDTLGYAQIAVRAAESLGDAYLIGLARGVRGGALRGLGRGAEAIPDLQAAVSANGNPTSESLRALAAALVDGGDIDGAIATYQQALAAAEAAREPLEVAGAHRDLGLMRLRQGQTSANLHAALHDWTAALAIYSEHKATAQAARLYCDIGSARKAMGQGARALKDFEEALTLLSTLDPADKETRGLVLSNAAIVYAEHGDAESADAFFTDAIALAQQIGDETSESTRSGNYGWFLLQVGRPRRAITLLGRALQLSQQLRLSLQHAVQTDNMGLAYVALGDSKTALDYHQKAYAEAQTLGSRYWVASFAVNHANALLDVGEKAAAQPLIAEALTFAHDGDYSDLIARAQLAAARLALDSGDLAGASSALDEAMTRARRADIRRLQAETLHLRSRLLALQGDLSASASIWEEAAKQYTMLHMPQGKTTPAWLDKA
jgi:tetratricopeptide (TPR) repeat protein